MILCQHADRLRAQGGLHLRHVLARKQDPARIGHALRDGVQGRGLARAVRPDDHEPLPFFHGERKPVDDFFLPKLHRQARNFQHRHAQCSFLD